MKTATKGTPVSDDRTTDPNQPGYTDGSSPSNDAPSASPYAPQSDTDSTSATASGDSDATASGTTTPDAPAYGAPPAPPYGAPDAASAPPAPPYGSAYDAPAPDAAASAYGSSPAAPAYDQQGYGQPAYGQQAYGQQAYGQPAYGQAYGQQYGYTAAPKTNLLAILSLIASIVGFIMFLPVIGQIAGVIMGHISLKQIKTTGERGHGMALAGLLIGYISLGLIVLFIIGISILVASTANSTSSGYGV